MPTPINVLILEDRQADAELMLHELRRAGFNPVYQCTDEEPEYLSALETNPEIILADWSMPQFSGWRALQILKEKGLDIPFIIVSGSIGEDAAVGAMREGASDYLLKDRLSRLGEAVRRSLDGKLLRDERKKAELVLRESEKRLASIYNFVGDVIYYLAIEPDNQYRFTSVNPAFGKITGIPIEKVIGKKVSEIIPEPSLSMVQGKYRQAIDEKTIVRWEEISEYPNGRLVGEVSVAPVFDDTGKCTNLVGSVHDITERKQWEENLRESEEKWHSLVSATPDYIALHNPEGQFLFLNHYAEGYAEKNVIGTSLYQFVAPGSVELFRHNMDKALKTWTTQRFEHNAAGDFGEEKTYEEFLVPMRGKNQQINILAVARDITERKRAEEALHESEAELRALFASMHEIVMVIDRAGIYRKFAPTNPELLIKPSEELLGKSLINVFPKVQAEAFMGAIQKVLETKQPTQIDYDLPLGDRIVKFEASVMPLTEGNTLWVARDITPRKLAEEKIIQLNAELEQRVEERTRELRQAQDKIVRQEKLAMLGQLAGGVGHELRNPLGIISSGIYYLKMIQPDADQRVRKYHAMIEQEVHNSEKIITDLLDFARLESMEKEPMAVSELVQRTLLRFLVPELIKTTLNLPADLPRVLADTRQMEQVLGNLIVNAYQAMLSPRGTSLLRSTTSAVKRGELTISAKMQKGMMGITVKDTGIGITPENMEKLFEPLFTTKSKGIGLGLAVSKKLAEANGGRIEVKSEPGKGSTFTLVLPVEEK
jgi:PAS domain S-box-containing protein